MQQQFYEVAAYLIQKIITEMVFRTTNTLFFLGGYFHRVCTCMYH